MKGRQIVLDHYAGREAAALLVGLPVSLISALVNVAVFRYWEMAQDNVTH